MLYLRERNKFMYSKFLKRVIDIVLSFCGLIVLLPVFALISLLIVIDDPGPVFFTQKRVGLNKTFFNIGSKCICL